MSDFSSQAVYAIYGILATILIFSYFTDVNKDNYVYITVGFLILSILGTYILRKGSFYLETFNEKKCLIALLLLCFAVKLTWVYFYRIEPQVDYATFYNTAVSLSDNFVYRNRYISLFPHIFGYASFLSIFIKVFGSNYMIPPIVNVVLTTISMGFIYYICKKISGVKTAIIASILWIIFPSQTIYNMFALSEPLYCTILLMIWTLMIIINKKLSNITFFKLFSYSVLLALLLTFMNMARPIAAVPIIALAIWLFIIDTGHVGNKKNFMNKAVYLVTVIVSYYLFSFAANQYISVRLGEEIALTPGYNIYVGFNMNSLGTWNEEDSKLLFYYSNQEGMTADEAQKRMLEEAKLRLQSGEINFPILFYHKFLIFLNDDSAAASYAGSVLNHPLRFKILSNIFYYFLMFASLLGVMFASKQRNKTSLFFICLYTIGLIMAQMLVEVASRYHYSFTIPMLILAAFGISRIFNNGKTVGINNTLE
ncbi:hypothetical protein FAY30_20745 [Bacillus sp. S3]|nr:hypothetical protein FAY30_20745 [Bacillus sp. S3]